MAEASIMINYISAGKNSPLVKEIYSHFEVGDIPPQMKPVQFKSLHMDKFRTVPQTIMQNGLNFAKKCIMKPICNQK